ncbi:Rho-related protein from plants 9 [Zea mays]|uniref:Rho-related protein from plants 9 n=1 Tax=Zea mays TaxID=4577 RepID=A0A1D6GYU4_MAIZE|nr:Rho-related protein from plants 9 [Zea mays]AQK67934.1 Rho-related protein from plants 9 [Zea mays]
MVLLSPRLASAKQQWMIPPPPPPRFYWRLQRVEAFESDMFVSFPSFPPCDYLVCVTDEVVAI